MYRFYADHTLQRKDSVRLPVDNALYACTRKKKSRLNIRIYKQALSKITGLLALLLFLASGVKAQGGPDYAIHANIIYHFTKYIDWPDNKKSGDFIIGIIGDTPLYDELKTNVSNKKVGYQKIVVKKFSSSATTYNCHILFISEEESDGVKKIETKTANTPTLLVSESEGLAKKGACINFIIVADRLKLEINKNNIEDRGLSIASELLQLGKIVK
ncbi:MAG: YfiR family protein [Ferruginibacter sp.]|nr:YfiR family protein [Chitinophagaceae bacterium]